MLGRRTCTDLASLSWSGDARMLTLRCVATSVQQKSRAAVRFWSVGKHACAQHAPSAGRPRDRQAAHVLCGLQEGTGPGT